MIFEFCCIVFWCHRIWGIVVCYTKSEQCPLYKSIPYYAMLLHYVHLHRCICMLFTLMYIHAYVHIYITCILYTHIRCVCESIYIYVHTQYMCTMQIFTYTYIHACMHTYVRAYVYTYT